MCLGALKGALSCYEAKARPPCVRTPRGVWLVAKELP
jgi:hypothetical protein